jgi:RHS repeat-associated protein
LPSPPLAPSRASIREGLIRILPGQYYDVETGTHNNYYRDYDPTTGRYEQSDPIGLAGGTNTFLYANGRPISLKDFLGLCATWTEYRTSWELNSELSKVETLAAWTVKIPEYGWRLGPGGKPGGFPPISLCYYFKGFNEWYFRLLQYVEFWQEWQYMRTCEDCPCSPLSCTAWTKVGIVNAREKRGLPWLSVQDLGFFPAGGDQSCVRTPFPWDMPKF